MARQIGRSSGIPPRGDNLYVSLLSKAPDDQPIIWSSLNYECLLEVAAARIGKKVHYFGEPSDLQDDQIAVWKLHGSCNFKVKDVGAGRQVSFGTGVVFGGRIEPLNPPEVRRHYSGNTSLYPSMALYAEGKTISMAPGPVQNGQKRWAEILATAEKALIIGVHPHPGDDHIWDPLAEMPGTLAYIGAESQFEGWRSSERSSGDSEYLGSTWAEAADEASEFLYD